ncbi:hypothetical protein FQN57_002357 [Myotisia sp. PD_48]|nr:hypothetical protein FQN57_002357 [Myotisia sp. PD_48]
MRGPNLNSCHTVHVLTATRMSAARQPLKAVESLHKCGIIHGDVNSGNVLWDMVPLDKYNTTTKYKYLCRPKRLPIKPELWKPGELVGEATIPQSLLGEELYLGDFGLATDAENQVVTEWRPALGYCPPERMHGFPASFAGDMWGYMCIYLRLYFDYFLLGRGITRIRGPMPEWKGQGGAWAEDKMYDQNTTFDPRAKLEDRIKFKNPGVSTAELGHMTSIVLRVLRYDPKERLTATQLLNDASFRAVMDIYCP